MFRPIVDDLTCNRAFRTLETLTLHQNLRESVTKAAGELAELEQHISRLEDENGYSNHFCTTGSVR